METISDSSYGVVPVIRENGEWQVLVVHQISYRGDDFWIFPKGHAEDNETPEVAALRELTEETGVTSVKLEPALPLTISYTFNHENVRIDKTVIYWIGYCEAKDTVISQPHEIKELRWCSLSQAADLLTHKNSTDVLDKVQNFLMSSQ